jgi:predicted PurR-regulated permease PerM
MNTYNPKIALIKGSLLVLAVVLVLLLLGIWLFSNIMLYLLISLVLTTILRPLVNSLSRSQVWGVNMPRSLAILLAFLIVIFVLVLFIVQFVPLVSDQIDLLSTLNFDSLYEQATQPLLRFEEFLIKYELTQHEPGYIIANLKDYIQEGLSHLDVRRVVSGIVNVTGSVLIGLMAVLFITFFLLQEKGLLRRNFISLIPNPYFEVSIAAIYKIEKLLSNYLLALLLQMFAVFSISSLGLSLLGIKYALTIGVFAAVANLIPYAGPFLGASFGILVAVSTTHVLPSWNDYAWLMLKIVAVFSLVQLIDNLLVQPLVFSKSVKAHPLEIFLVIFAGASIGEAMGSGVGGMILAVPAYTVVRVSFLEFYKGYSQYKVFRK